MSINSATHSPSPSVSRPGSPRSSSRRSILKHAPSSDRMDVILNTARERSLAMRPQSQPQSQSTTPRNLSPTRSQQPSMIDNIAEETVSEPGENTPIIRAEHVGRDQYPMDFGTLDRNGDPLRNRKSMGSIRRDTERRAMPPPMPVQDVDDVEIHDESWWQKQIAKYGSIELENKGSVARDHLALERTYLAWLRTSLSFASIGIAITQLFRLNTTTLDTPTSPDSYSTLRQLGKPLGATFVAISIVVLFTGFHRYFEGQHWLMKGKFPASRGSVSLITFVAFALMVASLVIVLAVSPAGFEKKDVYGIDVQNY